MSRVDSVKIAILKAQLPLAAASCLRRLFPFPDGVEEGAKGRRHSRDSARWLVRDPDVIAAADRLGLAMVFAAYAFQALNNTRIL